MERFRRNYSPDFVNISDEELNTRFADSIVNQVMLMCTNLFTWEGLPDQIEPWMIEEQLFGLGWCGFGYDEKYGYLALWSNEQDLMSINWRPTRVQLIGNGNIFSRLVYYGTDTERTLLVQAPETYNPTTACVVIRNNPAYISTFDLIYPYLYAFWAGKRKEITMLDQLQLQSLITASPEDRAQIEGLKRDIKKNKPIIALNVKGLKSEPKALTLAKNNDLLELQTFSKSIYGELMERIGIKSLNYEKKETMLTAEIEQNQEQTNATADALLRERQLACDRINELFGLNISVSLNEQVKVSEDEPTFSASASDIHLGGEEGGD